MIHSSHMQVLTLNKVCFIDQSPYIELDTCKINIYIYFHVTYRPCILWLQLDTDVSLYMYYYHILYFFYMFLNFESSSPSISLLESHTNPLVVGIFHGENISRRRIVTQCHNHIRTSLQKTYQSPIGCLHSLMVYNPLKYVPLLACTPSWCITP